MNIKELYRINKYAELVPIIHCINDKHYKISFFNNSIDISKGYKLSTEKDLGFKWKEMLNFGYAVEQMTKS